MCPGRGINLKKRDYSEDLGEDGIIILKCMLKNVGGRKLS